MRVNVSCNNFNTEAVLEKRYKMCTCHCTKVCSKVWIRTALIILFFIKLILGDNIENILWMFRNRIGNVFMILTYISIPLHRTYLKPTI